MTKPIGVNAQLATTCSTCGERILTAYPNESHLNECVINRSLQDVERNKLKRVDVSAELSALLATDHKLPFTVCKIDIPNGSLIGVYAPNWLVLGMDMYSSMYMDGVTLGDFLRALNQ